VLLSCERGVNSAKEDFLLVKNVTLTHVDLSLLLVEALQWLLLALFVL